MLGVITCAAVPHRLTKIDESASILSDDISYDKTDDSIVSTPPAPGQTHTAQRKAFPRDV